MEANKDFSFPVGFKEAVCEALLSVCKDRLSYGSLSLAGSLGISLDHGKMTYLQIVESIARNEHWPPDTLSNNFAGPIIKQEAELLSFECCDDQTSVIDEPLEEVKGQIDVLDNNVCEGSSACNSCDGEITENDSNANYFVEYIESKVEKHGESIDNSIDEQNEQDVFSCSDLPSDHQVSLAQTNHAATGEKPQGNTKACSLLLILYRCR